MASRTVIPSQTLARLTSLASRVQSSRVIYKAAQGTMIDVSRRVWDDGKLTSGAPLTYKENYQVWVYTPPFPRKPSKQLGKPNKDGKRRKIAGGWFPTYLAAKEDQGRKDRPFELTGRYRKAYFGGGSTPAPREVNPLRVQVVLRGEEADKFDGLTESKGPHLELTEAEERRHHARVQRIYRDEVLNKP